MHLPKYYETEDPKFSSCRGGGVSGHTCHPLTYSLHVICNGVTENYFNVRIDECKTGQSSFHRDSNVAFVDPPVSISWRALRRKPISLVEANHTDFQ